VASPDLVSGGHNDRGSEGASGVGYREGCLLPSQLEGLGERRELPQRSPERSKKNTILLQIPR